METLVWSSELKKVARQWKESHREENVSAYKISNWNVTEEETEALLSFQLSSKTEVRSPQNGWT